jgi:DnaJ-class molecular chaperone
VLAPLLSLPWKSTPYTMENYYDLLGIKRNATEDEIKSAYHQKAKEFHPDKNNGSEESSEMFRRIKEAYDTLFDPIRRTGYDDYLSQLEANKNKKPIKFNDVLFPLLLIIGAVFLIVRLVNTRRS